MRGNATGDATAVTHGQAAEGAVGRAASNVFAAGDAELGRALRARLRGGVRIDPGARALYSTDASNYRQLPIAVVNPRDAADVEATLEVCRQRGLPVLSRGGGTSLAGQTCNTAVVLDFSRHMNRIPVRRWRCAPPGRPAVFEQADTGP